MLITRLWSKAFWHNQCGNNMEIFPINEPKPGVPLSCYVTSNCSDFLPPLKTVQPPSLYPPTHTVIHQPTCLFIGPTWHKDTPQTHQKIMKDSAAPFRVFTMCSFGPAPTTQEYKWYAEWAWVMQNYLEIIPKMMQVNHFNSVCYWFSICTSLVFLGLLLSLFPEFVLSVCVVCLV